MGEQFRFFVSGGAKLPEDLAENLARLGFTVLEGYGLTETAPVVTLNPPEAPRLGSAGRPLDGVEVRILHPDADGVGEVLIRGDNVMAGYYQNEAATREVLKDGWFHSGDLGHLDRDGYLFVKGRIKEIIVLSFGQERLRRGSGPALPPGSLHQGNLRDRRRPGREAGRRGGAGPGLFPENRGNGHLRQGEVGPGVDSQGLEPYKRVRDFVLINEELPKTRLGKIKIHEAQRLYQERAGKRYVKPKSRPLEEGLSPVGETVVEVLARQIGDARISLDDHLELDLGLDSLGLVELLAALERRFNLKIKDEEFTGIFTVRELIGFIEAKNPEAAREPEAEVAAWGSHSRGPSRRRPCCRRLGLEGGFAARMVTQGLASVLGLLV